MVDIRKSTCHLWNYIFHFACHRWFEKHPQWEIRCFYESQKCGGGMIWAVQLLTRYCLTDRMNQFDLSYRTFHNHQKLKTCSDGTKNELRKFVCQMGRGFWLTIAMSTGPITRLQFGRLMSRKSFQWQIRNLNLVKNIWYSSYLVKLLCMDRGEHDLICQ